MMILTREKLEQEMVKMNDYKNKSLLHIDSQVW